MSFEAILLVPGFDDTTPVPNQFESLFFNPILSDEEGNDLDTLFEIEEVS